MLKGPGRLTAELTGLREPVVAWWSLQELSRGRQRTLCLKTEVLITCGHTRARQAEGGGVHELPVASHGCAGQGSP